jgi:hypothetical protein
MFARQFREKVVIELSIPVVKMDLLPLSLITIISNSIFLILVLLAAPGGCQHPRPFLFSGRSFIRSCFCLSCS